MYILTNYHPIAIYYISHSTFPCVYLASDIIFLIFSCSLLAPLALSLASHECELQVFRCPYLNYISNKQKQLLMFHLSYCVYFFDYSEGKMKYNKTSHCALINTKKSIYMYIFS